MSAARRAAWSWSDVKPVPESPTPERSVQPRLPGGAPCPCCGRPMEGRPDPVVLLQSIAFGKTKRPIVDVLAQRFGKWVRSDSIVVAMYADRIDGGPECATGVLAVQIHHLRRILPAYGLSIESQASSGYRMVWS